MNFHCFVNEQDCAHELLFFVQPGYIMEWSCCLRNREAALAFLGLSGVSSPQCFPEGVCSAKHLGSESVKVHPGGCETKITNWAEVREALKGTDTFVACESQTARSSNSDRGGIVQTELGAKL